MTSSEPRSVSGEAPWGQGRESPARWERAEAQSSVSRRSGEDTADRMWPRTSARRGFSHRNRWTVPCDVWASACAPAHRSASCGDRRPPCVVALCLRPCLRSPVGSVVRGGQGVSRAGRQQRITGGRARAERSTPFAQLAILRWRASRRQRCIHRITLKTSQGVPNLSDR